MPGPAVVITLVDDAGGVWRFPYEQRSEATVTGSIVGAWGDFCAASRLAVGDGLEFWRPHDVPALPPGVVGARVRVVRSAALTAADAAAAATQAYWGGVAGATA